jgi:hypothetical protein
MRKLRHVKWGLPVVLVMACSASSLNRSSAPPSVVGPRSLLLFQEQPIEAAYIAEHVAEVDAIPFDGLVFQIPSSAAIADAPISEAAFADQLAPMRAANQSLTRVRENFVYVRFVQAGSLESQQPTVAENLANLAGAARAANLAGIVYDNENYEPTEWDTNVVCPGATLSECQVKVAAAGEVAMRQIVDRWPTARVMSLFGPATSHAGSYRALLGEEPTPQHLLLASYGAGLVTATIGTDATFIDGGEKFSVHSAADAAADRRTRLVSMPAESPLVADATREAWVRKLSLAFSLYDEANGTPKRWRDDIAVNLSASDRYAWAFSFNHVWVGAPQDGKVAATSEWIDATRAGRARALHLDVAV